VPRALAQTGKGITGKVAMHSGRATLFVNVTCPALFVPSQFLSIRLVQKEPGRSMFRCSLGTLLCL